MTLFEPENPRAVAGSNSIDDGQLLSIVERVEELEAEKKQTADAIKDVYAEAKGNGYDVKIIRKVVARRRADRDTLDEEESLLELYERAIERRGSR